MRKYLGIGVLGLFVASGCAGHQRPVSAQCLAAMSGSGPVGCNWDGRLEMFKRGPGGALYHQWQTSPEGRWSGWESLAGVLTSEPVVGHNADGRLEVFGRGTNGALFHRWQLVPGGAWADWESLGGDLTSEITVSRTPDGRLAVSARGTDGALWYIRQLSPSGEAWSRWSPLGDKRVAPVQPE